MSEEKKYNICILKKLNLIVTENTVIILENCFTTANEDYSRFQIIRDFEEFPKNVLFFRKLIFKVRDIEYFFEDDVFDFRILSGKFEKKDEEVDKENFERAYQKLMETLKYMDSYERKIIDKEDNVINKVCVFVMTSFLIFYIFIITICLKNL